MALISLVFNRFILPFLAGFKQNDLALLFGKEMVFSHLFPPESLYIYRTFVSLAMIFQTEKPQRLPVPSN
jgi:hypothetical protein